MSNANGHENGKAPKTVTDTTTTTSFTEGISNVSTTQDTGNFVTGAYTTAASGTITTTDSDSYGKLVTISSLAQNSLTSPVMESSSETSASVETGNSITGAYTTSATATRTYSLNDSEADYSLTTVVSGGSATVTSTLLENSALTEIGTLGSTTNETGNTVDGNYSRTIAGTDAYSMTESGTNTGNAFSENLTGTDTVTLTETGNPSADTFDRSIVGTGTYNRTDAGAGATLSNVTGGAISYSLAETGDALGAVFSQVLTGTDRYGLLEHFTDVSNTGGGNGLGNMNFYPFGQAFVDPNLRTVFDHGGGSRVYVYDNDDWVIRSADGSYRYFPSSGPAAGIPMAGPIAYDDPLNPTRVRWTVPPAPPIPIQQLPILLPRPGAFPGGPVLPPVSYQSAPFILRPSIIPAGENSPFRSQPACPPAYIPGTPGTPYPIFQWRY
jgi:hypothetical protein